MSPAGRLRPMIRGEITPGSNHFSDTGTARPDGPESRNPRLSRARSGVAAFEVAAVAATTGPNRGFAGHLLCRTGCATAILSITKSSTTKSPISRQAARIRRQRLSLTLAIARGSISPLIAHRPWDSKRLTRRYRPPLPPLPLSAPWIMSYDYPPSLQPANRALTRSPGYSPLILRYESLPVNERDR